MNAKKKKVLVIGWDAADWKVINPLVDQGLMPHLAAMMEEGASGNLATLDPPLSPMLWTSIATGVRPYKHGITGFTEVSDDGKGLRPVTLRDRKVKAVWNILSDHGIRTNVVGWWPSHPAEAVNGIMISNFYQRASRPITEPWPMKKGSVYPASKEELFAAMRIHPGELTENHIAAFAPRYGLVDQKKEKGLQSLARILADNSTVHAAATYILEYEPWDFMAVYYDGIDHFNHAFMKFHPPKRDYIDDRMYEIFKDAVTAGYRFHDLMLGRLLKLAGEDTTVILLSDHGFHPDHLRKKKLLRELAGPADEHSRYGILCARGPGIRRDELVYGAGLLDITPTLLSLYGLPVGEDMDGKPLLSLFEQPPAVSTVPTWNDGTAAAVPVSAPDASDQEALQQLADLGYIAPLGGDKEEAGRNTTRENNYFMSRAWMDGERYDEAIALLEVLFRERPWELRFAQTLALCLQRQQRFDEAEAVIRGYRQAAPAKQAELEREAAKLEKEFKPVDTGPSVDLLMASLHMARQQADEALALLRKYEHTPHAHGKLHLRIGNCWAMKRDWPRAIAGYRKELEYNYDEPEAHHGLGFAKLRSGKPGEAVEHLLDAIGLQFHYPVAHYHLGESLLKLEDWENAVQAYRVCLRMAPGMNKARQRLAFILEEKLGREDEAQAYREQIPEELGEPVFVVSGLPRSGTSMLMRMLAAGGMPLFTDKKRAADADNPHGYFEHEAVTRLASDSRWIGEAAGQAIKVVSPLVPYLPPRYRYKILHIERPMEQVMQSQQVMLQRSGKTRATAYSLQVVRSYESMQRKAKAWFEKNKRWVDVLPLDYESVLADPAGSAAKIREFLGTALDAGAMARAVDPSLHRNKSAAEKPGA